MKAIPPYPMPGEADLTTGPAGWRPDPARAALLVHDMQRWFVDFLPAGRSPTVELLANTARLVAHARRRGMPVLHSAQPGRMPREVRGLLYDFWGPGMPPDPAARRIVPEVAPEPGEPVLTKYRYSAFFRTGLASRLAALGRDQLVICGVYTHIGCLATAVDALSHDVQAFLVADATADLTRRDHLAALDYAARYCAVTTTTGRLLADQRTSGRGRPSAAGRRPRAPRPGAGP